MSHETRAQEQLRYAEQAAKSAETNLMHLEREVEEVEKRLEERLEQVAYWRRIVALEAGAK